MAFTWIIAVYWENLRLPTTHHVRKETKLFNTEPGGTSNYRSHLRIKDIYCIYIYIYMCVCVCACVYIYIYVCVCVCVWTTSD